MNNDVTFFIIIKIFKLLLKIIKEGIYQMKE